MVQTRSKRRSQQQEPSTAQAPPPLLQALPPDHLPSITRWLAAEDKRSARLACRELRSATDASVTSLALAVTGHVLRHEHEAIRAEARAAGKQVGGWWLSPLVSKLRVHHLHGHLPCGFGGLNSE